MSVYLVTWDLNKEKANYAQARAAFLAHMDALENKGDPRLDSVRFVSTALSAEQVSNLLQGMLDNNDRLIVAKMVNGSHHGWLAKDVWDWINARL
jgi:hypothetical protein